MASEGNFASSFEVLAPRFTSYSSLLPLIRAQVELRGEAVAMAFLKDGEAVSGELTYADLWDEALSIAAVLNERLEVGTRVLLLYPPGLHFLPAFIACLSAGVLPVISSYSRQESGNQRLAGIAKDCSPLMVLSQSSETDCMEQLVAAKGVLEGLPLLFTDSLELQRKLEGTNDPEIDDLAFLQYTSGSTAEPRGVMISHRNLMHNLEMHRIAIDFSSLNQPEAVFVSWLPHFHQMGLVSVLLLSLGIGGKVYFMPPLAFVKRPARWMKAVTRFGGTVIGGPNFAYDLCAKTCVEAERANLDLSELKVAFISSEPIHRTTLSGFTRAFEDSGFDEQRFIPAYGQAENTTLVAWKRGVFTLWVNQWALGQGRVVPLAGEDVVNGVELVASGTVASNPSLCIVDAERSILLPDGDIGEIWLQGDDVVQGYWDKQGAQVEVFHAQLKSSGKPSGAYLRTGDLGFIFRKHIFITGRSKELIIVRGRNIYPQDVERTVEASHEALKQGRGAAFSVDGPSGERVICVQELTASQQDADDYEPIAACIQHEVTKHHQVRLSELILVRRNAVPRTTSGKIARVACKSNWEQGEVRGERVRFAWDTCQPPSEVDVLSDCGDVEHLEAWLKQQVQLRMGMAVVDPTVSLYQLGFDSMALFEFVGEVEQALKVTVPWEVFAFEPNLRCLSRLLCQSPDNCEVVKKDSLDLVEPAEASPSFAERLRFRVLSAGPRVRNISVPYVWGIRWLRELTSKPERFERWLSVELALLRRVYAEIEPEIELREFLQRSLMANLWLPWKQAHWEQDRIYHQWAVYEGMAQLEAQLAQGRGAILAATHTPWMHLVGRMPALAERAVCYLGHLKGKHLKRAGGIEMSEAYQRAGDTAESRLALRTAQLHQAKACLKAGGVVILFPDDTEGYGGVKLSFFNRMRPLRPGMAELSLQCDVPIFPISAQLELDGRLCFQLQETLPEANSVEAILESYMVRLRSEWKKSLHSFEWRMFKKYDHFPEA